MCVGISGDAFAQDCREHCEHCSTGSGAPEWYESSGFAEENGWKGACSDDFCRNCAPESIKDAPAIAAVILDAVRLARPAEIRDIVHDYGQFLLVHVDRRLLVIKGLGCDPDDLGAVVPLSVEKTHALRAAGVQDLAEFISNRAREVTTAADAR